MTEHNTIDPKKNRLILVLLTEPIISKLMTTIINTEGYTNVIVAKNKDEARAIIDSEHVDLFITNNRLGGITGEDFIRETVLKTAQVTEPDKVSTTKTLLFTGGWVDKENSPATKIIIQNNTSAREIATTVNSLLNDP